MVNRYQVLSNLSTNVDPSTFKTSVAWDVTYQDENEHESLCDAFDFINTTVDRKQLLVKGKPMQSCAASAIKDVFNQSVSRSHRQTFTSSARLPEVYP